MYSQKCPTYSVVPKVLVESSKTVVATAAGISVKVERISKIEVVVDG